MHGTLLNLQCIPTTNSEGPTLSLACPNTQDAMLGSPVSPGLSRVLQRGHDEV